MVLVCNGSTSSGKTLLIEEFVKQSKLLFLRMGIDLLWGKILPYKYIMFNEDAHLGFRLKKEGTKIITETGIYGKKISELFIQTVNIYTEAGFNVIIDDVI
ncbi:MAG: phosphotransferase-like protein, partial [Bacteroidota bacterium]